MWFATLAQLISRGRWAEVFPVTPATLLAWHRRLEAQFLIRDRGSNFTQSVDAVFQATGNRILRAILIEYQVTTTRPGRVGASPSGFPAVSTKFPATQPTSMFSESTENPY